MEYIDEKLAARIRSEARAVEYDYPGTNFQACYDMIVGEICGTGFGFEPGDVILVPNSNDTYEQAKDGIITIMNPAYCYYGGSVVLEYGSSPLSSQQLRNLISDADRRSMEYVDHFASKENPKYTNIEQYLSKNGIVPGDSLFTGSERRQKALRELYEVLITIVPSENQPILRELEAKVAAEHQQAAAAEALASFLAATNKSK